jgi:hypothetical protein
MKQCLSTFNYKILYLTILTVQSKNLNQIDCSNCKIITIEGNEKVFLVECLECCQCIEIQGG